MTHQFLFNIVMSSLLAGVTFVSLATHQTLSDLRNTQPFDHTARAVPALPKPLPQAPQAEHTLGLEPDLMRQILREELAPISTQMAAIEARIATTSERPLARSGQTHQIQSTQNTDALRADIDRTIRQISRSNPGFGQQQRELMRKIAQLPPAQRADVLRDLNRRMNE